MSMFNSKMYVTTKVCIFQEKRSKCWDIIIFTLIGQEFLV